MIEKNKKDWNAYAEAYARYNHSDKVLGPVAEDPSKAFHHTTWELIQRYLPHMKGKKICVPSSGDNLAVFAFALLGARVTSCDIAENQLAHAKSAAEKLGVAQAITFVCADTVTLEGVTDDTYDLVYTSNGVHVWIDDLAGMYRSIYRVLKSGGLSIMYEIHPFLRPFDDDLKVIKPYDWTGPFETEQAVTFAWRVQDFLNAMLDAGIRLEHVEEMYAEKDYAHPFWVSNEKVVNGLKVSREEVDRMHDWRVNPSAALPNWLCTVGRK